MNEKPILFSAEMVRAILDGRKTQTRRVIKPQPPDGFVWCQWAADEALFCRSCDDYMGKNGQWIKCPYGQSGDRLWVREAWKLWSNATDWYVVTYPATGIATHPIRCLRDLRVLEKRGIKAARFMPREFSRITPRVTGVRVERVQEITEDDAKAEGAALAYDGDYSPHQGFNHRGGFMALWDSINAKRGFSWDANPWVWAVEFEEQKGGT